jgi:hypothetical protein
MDYFRPRDRLTHFFLAIRLSMVAFGTDIILRVNTSSL